MLVAVVLGVVAGVVTTVAGMGGGIVMMLALSAYWGDPVRALAVTAPALLVGNLHRLWLFRRSLDWGVALPYAAGILPGALIGGLLAVSVPPLVVQGAMMGGALAAILHAGGWLKVSPSASTLLPAGAGIGVVGGTSGGAGFLSGPLLLACGLTGGAYLATGALAGVVLNLGRSFAYGLGGSVDAEVLVLGAQLSVAIAGGNVLGRGVRARLGPSGAHWVELGVAVGGVGLALLGLTRVASAAP